MEGYCIKKIYVHNGTLLDHKKDEILPFLRTEMGLEEYAKWNKSEGEW